MVLSFRAIIKLITLWLCFNSFLPGDACFYSYKKTMLQIFQTYLKTQIYKHTPGVFYDWHIVTSVIFRLFCCSRCARSRPYPVYMRTLHQMPFLKSASLFVRLKMFLMYLTFTSKFYLVLNMHELVVPRHLERIINLYSNHIKNKVRSFFSLIMDFKNHNAKLIFLSGYFHSSM